MHRAQKSTNENPINNTRQKSTLKSRYRLGGLSFLKKRAKGGSWGREERWVAEAGEDAAIGKECPRFKMRDERGKGLGGRVEGSACQ